MTPIVAVPNVQVPPTVEASVFAGQISDPAIGRLPFNTVPAPVSSSKVADDSRNNQQSSSSDSTDDASSTSSSDSEFVSSLTTEESVEAAFSTTFIAQLFGQIPASDDVIGTLFGDGTGIPSGFVDYSRLAEFGGTKYKPSDAAKPEQKSPQAQALDSGAAAPDKAQLEAEVEQAVAETSSQREQLAAAVEEQEIRVQVAKAQTAPVNVASQASPPTSETKLATETAQKAQELAKTRSPVEQAPKVEAAPVQSAAADSVALPSESSVSIYNSGVNAYSSTQGRNTVNANNAPRGEVNLVS